MSKSKCKQRITAFNDAFFDDICAFIYAIGINQDCDLITTALGYSTHDTARRVTDGLVEWAKKQNVSFQKSMISQTFYDNTDSRNNLTRSIIDLNFASNMADHLQFNNCVKHKKCDKIKYSKIIWVLGPYSDLARKMESTCHKYNVWASGSNVFNADSDPFPVTIYIDKGDNAGIDPTATLKVWKIANSYSTAILVSRQPPIQDVYDAIRSIKSDAAKKMRKVLRYSLDNNPGGVFVWDLGCAITQQHPDIIIGSQLYDADYSDDPNKAIKLTQSQSQSQSPFPQVIIVNISIRLMLQYLCNDLKKCHH